MADKIRGITIQIGGDTSGLTKALKASNSEIKSTQSQLRDVNNLLKLDPTNIDLLKQKEQLLNQQVAETKTKVSELKQIQQTMDENGVDKNSEQYMALQREIIATESAFESAKEDADGYNAKLEQMAAKSEQVADKANKVAEKTWGISAAIAALGIGAVETTAEFDSNMSQLAATMGVSTDEIQELREFAKQMGEQTAFSASEAAQGLNILAQSGLSAEEQMAVLPSVLDLAAAGGIDMATAASYVVGSINGFGGSMNDAATYADLMAKGATLAATDVNGLGEALSGTAATAASYGQTADDVAEAALRLANQNVTGSEAVTGLNRVMSDLYNPSSQAAKQLKRLGVSAYDANNKARPLNDVVNELNEKTADMSDKKRANVLGQIFSDKGLQTFNKMAATTGDELDILVEGLEDAGGSAGQQAETMLDNMSGKLTLLKSAVEGAAISIGEKLTPYIEKLIGWVQSAVEWFNGLSDEQLDMILTIAGIVAAIAPVAKAISGVSKAAGGLSKAFKFLKANPFLLIISAIIALGVLIGKNAKKIREALQKVDDFLQNVFATDFTEIFGDGVIGKALNGFMDGIKFIWDGIKKYFDWIINFLEKLVNGDWQGVWDMLKETATGIWDKIKEKINKAIDFIKKILKGDFAGAFGEDSAIGKALTSFSSFVSGIWDDIKGFFTGAYDTVKALFEGDFTTVFGEDSAIGKAFSGFSSFASDIWDDVTGFFDDAYSTVDALFKGDFTTVFGEGSAIRTAFDGFSTFVSGIWEDIKGFFSGAYDTISSLFETDFTTIFGEGSFIGIALNTLRDLFSNRLELIKGFFTGAYETISALLKGDFAGAFGNSSPIGKAITSLRTKFSLILNAIAGFFDTCFGKVKTLLEGDFAAVFGENSGIVKAVNSLKEKVSTIFGEGEGGFIQKMKQGLNYVRGTFSVGWSSAWSSIKSKFSSIWGSLASAVKSPINGVITYINSMIDKINSFIDNVNSIKVFGMSTSIGHIGHISKLAKGGVVQDGGMALVGESGAELLTVSNGHATVTPLGGGRSSGNVINVYAQEMTEAQVDYLINRVNRGLMYA